MKRAPIIFEALINLLTFVIIGALTGSNIHLFTQLILTGMIIRIVFEYTFVNES